MKTVFQKLTSLVSLIVLVSCGSNAESKHQDAIAQNEATPIAETETETATMVETHGQLHIKDGTIVDKNNNPVQLRGMSFFWSQWMGKYYTPETVAWLKNDWQCTVVRAAMAVDKEGGYITNPEREKKKIFTVIDAAITQGIYVIVDWHSHHAEDYVDQAKLFFGEVAQKYGDLPNIIYEPYNEPLEVSWTDVLKPYHEKIISEIRKYDPDNIVVCGTPVWSQRVDQVIDHTIADSNTAYTLHYYAASHKADLRNLAQKALDKGIPLFVTEFGVTEYTGDGYIDVEETRAWWDFLDTNNISWCNWSIADKDENSAVLQPNTDATGGWTEDNLTEAGIVLRTELKSKNPVFK